MRDLGPRMWAGGLLGVSACPVLLLLIVALVIVLPA